jgi:hypothetical protein
MPARPRAPGRAIRCRMPDDLVAFVQQMDRCWLEQRFDDLARYIASDAVMAAPDGRTRLEASPPPSTAIDSS